MGINKYLRRSLFVTDYSYFQRLIHAAAIVGAGGHMLAYLMLKYGLHLRESLGVRVVASTVCLLALAILPRTRPYKHFHKVYFEFLLAVILVGAFTYLFLLNGANFYWTASLVCAGLIYGFISKPFVALWVYPFTALVTTFLFLLRNDLTRGDITVSLQIHSVGIFAVIMAGIVKVFVESTHYRLVDLKARTDHQNEIFSALLDISGEISGRDSLDDIFDIVLRRLDKIFPGRGFAVLVEGDRAKIVTSMAFCSLSDQERTRILLRHQEILSDEAEIKRHYGEYNTVMHSDKGKVAGMLGEANWQVLGGEITTQGMSGSLTHWLKFFVKGKDFDSEEKKIFLIFLDQLKGVTRTRIQAEELEGYANTDVLTGAYNRNYMESVMRDWLLRVGEQCYFSVLFADINQLKLVNDDHGHAAGDELIRAAYRLIRGSVRRTDMVFRHGGDELVIFCPSTTYEEAEIVRDRIREAEARAVVEFTAGDGANKVFLPLSISIGIACSQECPSEKILEVADLRMYKDKQEQRGRKK